MKTTKKQSCRESLAGLGRYKFRTFVFPLTHEGRNKFKALWDRKFCYVASPTFSLAFGIVIRVVI